MNNNNSIDSIKDELAQKYLNSSRLKQSFIIYGLLVVTIFLISYLILINIGTANTSSDRTDDNRGQVSIARTFCAQAQGIFSSGSPVGPLK